MPAISTEVVSDCGGTKSKEVTAMMPKMMESCFSKMDAQQRQGMLSMCREMRDQIEAKYEAQ